MNSMDRRPDTVEFALGEALVRAGFRILDASDLAGAPIELEFSVDFIGSGSRHLLIAADRARQRPGDFSFSATFAGAPLEDPYAPFPYMGGPAGVIEISAGHPWHQSLLLNEFVRLEQTIVRLEPGGSDHLVVACHRPLLLAADKNAALQNVGAVHSVESNLALDIRRDDVEFAALVRELIVRVRQGPREQRERPLAFLLATRAPMAVELWQTLLDHPDPIVSERVRNALQLTAGLSGR
jgi:hypothetical protein